MSRAQLTRHSGSPLAVYHEHESVRCLSSVRRPLKHLERSRGPLVWKTSRAPAGHLFASCATPKRCSYQLENSKPHLAGFLTIAAKIGITSHARHSQESFL